MKNINDKNRIQLFAHYKPSKINNILIITKTSRVTPNTTVTRAIVKNEREAIKIAQEYKAIRQNF